MIQLLWIQIVYQCITEAEAETGEGGEPLP